jgi:hypothetical protein
MGRTFFFNIDSGSFFIFITPNGELTSAAVLLREQPGFYEKPRLSRRLVKRRYANFFDVSTHKYFLIILPSFAQGLPTVSLIF